MTTIDQRILIPSPPDVVWEYVSNINNQPDWQTACESITFLSQKQEGVGTRWRERTVHRQEHVFEVTSWYDGLGYEYVFIDGGGFQTGKGRLRIQEIPEGTIVQWTFTYELGGVLSGLRNALTTQRRIEADMVESLKSLWKISRRMGNLEGYEARSLMRDGLQDPVERASYKSRHESKIKTSTEMPVVKITEPPVSEEDTRPRASLAQDSAPPVTEQTEPEAPSNVTDAPAAPQPPATAPEAPESTDADDHSRYAPPRDVDAAPPSVPVEPPTPDYAPTDEPAVTPADETFAPPSPAPEPKPVTTEYPAEPPPTTSDAPPLSVPAETPNMPAATPEPITSEADNQPDDNEGELKPKVPPGKDTAEMSIWEIFGIPSPTDTQRMRAIRAAEEAEREYEAEQAAPSAQAQRPASPNIDDDDDATVPKVTPQTDAPANGREGLRYSRRRNLIRVRRPGK